MSLMKYLGIMLLMQQVLQGALPTVPNPTLGQWCSNWATAKAYAEANGIPLIALWGSGSCTYCDWYDDALGSAPFIDWREKTPYIFIYVKDTKDAYYNWTWGTGTSRVLNGYPFVMFYWKKDNMVLVEQRYIGRQSPAPFGGYDTGNYPIGSPLAGRTRALAEQYFAAYSSVPLPTDAWDTNDDTLAGTTNVVTLTGMVTSQEPHSLNVVDTNDWLKLTGSLVGMTNYVWFTSVMTNGPVNGLRAEIYVGAGTTPVGVLTNLQGTFRYQATTTDPLFVRVWRQADTNAVVKYMVNYRRDIPVPGYIGYTQVKFGVQPQAAYSTPETTVYEGQQVTVWLSRVSGSDLEVNAMLGWNTNWPSLGPIQWGHGVMGEKSLTFNVPEEPGYQALDTSLKLAIASNAPAGTVLNKTILSLKINDKNYASASISNLVTSGEPVLGQWYGYQTPVFGPAGSFTEYTNLAARLNIPLIGYWGNEGCSLCNAFVGQLNTSLVQTWIGNQKVLFLALKGLISQDGYDGYNWIRPLLPDPNSTYPWVGLYWNSPTGLVQRSASLSNFTGQQFIDTMTTWLTGYANNGALYTKPQDAWDPNDDTREGTTNIVTIIETGVSQGPHFLNMTDTNDWYKLPGLTGMTNIIWITDVITNASVGGLNADIYVDNDTVPVGVLTNLQGAFECYLTTNATFSVRVYRTANTNSIVSYYLNGSVSNTVISAIGVNASIIGVTSAVTIDEDQSGVSGTSVRLGGIGLLGDGQMTGIEWSKKGNGILAFDWKVSSEEGWDWLSFYEVGVPATNRISGVTSWARQSVTVLGDSEQTHTFRWEYEKDPIGDYVGEDCGWVDAINWTPLYMMTVNSGSGDGYFTKNALVSITAETAPVDFEFDRWTGDTNGIANLFSSYMTFNMPATNVTLTATYKPILYALNVINGNGDGSYTNNAFVTITADAPPSHFEFDHWTGDTNKVSDIYSSETTFIITGSSVWLEATYKPIFYEVIIQNGSGDGSYTNGSTVAIYADEPGAHYVFDKWTGDTNGVNDVFAPNTMLTVHGSSVSVTATYKDILYPVTITGGLGGGNYSFGSTIDLIANVPEDKRFYRWSGSTNYIGDVNAATTTVYITGEPLFISALYTVPLTVNSGTGSGWYPEGSTTTVSADEDPLWKEFAAWIGDVGLLSNANVRTTILTMPTAAATVTATYKDSIARLTGSYGLTYSESGISGAITPDATADSPSGTPAVKLGGAGVIPDNGFVAFETVVTGSGTISFTWKVSSELNADYLKFKIDGTVSNQISGTKVPWTSVTNRVAGAGTHTLRWEYVKNGSLASSTDAGWVDDIVWMPALTDTPTPVPYVWLDQYPELLTQAGGNYDDAALADVDGDGHTAMQEYVTGSSPTNKASIFRAHIEMVEGCSHITWTPDMGTQRVYKVDGKTNLTDAAWYAPTNAGTRFFRVKAELP
jgi:hypothetical protein